MGDDKIKIEKFQTLNKKEHLHGPLAGGGVLKTKRTTPCTRQGATYLEVDAALMRAARRLTLREAERRLMVPFCAALANWLMTLLKVLAMVALSPALRADSNVLTVVPTRERLEVLATLRLLS